METNLAKAKEILSKYHQEHLIVFLDELSDSKKNSLINQILNIDFQKIHQLYINSQKESNDSNDVITPLPYFIKNNFSDDQIEHYENIGINSIKNNEFAVVTLAGGQGSRLGHNGPKGTFELDLAPKKKSLFEILNDNLKEIQENLNVTIPWYIMTSTANHKATLKFFEENNYFNYPKEHVHFFSQDNLPITDINGNLILEEPYKIKEASNGNGNVYEAMQKKGIIDDLKKRNIKWIFIGGIDNILLKIVDPLLLGLSIEHNVQLASKSLFKKDPMEKEYVFCKRNGKPSLLDYNNITEDISLAKDENSNYLYRETNMLSHLFSIHALEKCITLELPYHRAFKKNTFVNEEGMKQIPDKPNSFKFEKFIFDAFEYFDDMLLLRVNEDEEFAPIKNQEGKNTPETATKLYIKMTK